MMTFLKANRGFQRCHRFGTYHISTFSGNSSMIMRRFIGTCSHLGLFVSLCERGLQMIFPTKTNKIKKGKKCSVEYTDSFRISPFKCIYTDICVCICFYVCVCVYSNMEVSKSAHVFALLVCTFCWLTWSVSGVSNIKGVIRSENYQGGLCSIFVKPYSQYNCHEYSVGLSGLIRFKHLGHYKSFLNIPPQIGTSDGFRLGVQRLNIPSFSKGPVLLNHGVLSGGDSWILNPPGESPAFILADAGYDVWIGNARTTSFSYGHEYLTEKDKAYWDWSVDELAAIDLPTMVYLVNNITKRNMHLVGFSQGTQAALAAFSQGYIGDTVEKVALLAPIAYVSHAYTPIGIAAVALHLDKVFQDLGLLSFSTKTKTGKQYVDMICKAANMRCFEGLTDAFTGINCCINISRRAFYEKYETQTTSTKNLAHLAQMYRANKFQKYDYGLLKNLIKYGSADPPVYDLSKVPKQKLFLAAGEKDALSNELDVERLKMDLGGQGFQYLYKPTYAHLDFILAYNCKQEVYDHVISFFESKA